MPFPVLRTLPVRLATAAAALALLASSPTLRAETTTATATLDVQVVVTSSDGQPLQGVLVEARVTEGRTIARTDAEGRALLTVAAHAKAPGRLHVRAGFERPVSGTLPVVSGASNLFGQGGPHRMSASISVVEGGVTP